MCEGKFQPLDDRAAISWTPKKEPLASNRFTKCIYIGVGFLTTELNNHFIYKILNNLLAHQYMS